MKTERPLLIDLSQSPGYFSIRLLGLSTSTLIDGHLGFNLRGEDGLGGGEFLCKQSTFLTI